MAYGGETYKAPIVDLASRTPGYLPARLQRNIIAGGGQAAYLYQWGTIQFLVWPLNIHEANHQTETDWAKKELAGAAIQREWVGENDEELHFRGKLFPYRIGGMGELEATETLRRQGIAQLMMRGDGWTMGWYVLERMIRIHEHLSPEGVGQEITFEALFARVPIPAAENFFPVLWQAGVVGR